MKAVTCHPIGDPYHCAYRSLSILGNDLSRGYEKEKFRILDFYFLFPSLLPKIRKTKELGKAIRKLDADLISPPYQILPHPRTLFRQIEGVQVAAITHLVSKGALDMPSFHAGVIKIADSKLKKTLATKAFQDNRMKPLLSVISNELSSIQLHGKTGLKDRTSLMEFRYDNV